MRKIRRLYRKWRRFYKRNEWQIQLVIILLMIAFTVGTIYGATSVANQYNIAL